MRKPPGQGREPAGGFGERCEMASLPQRSQMSTKVIRTKPEPYCPDCGARMTLRRPSKGGILGAVLGLLTVS
jgi:ribosomal protein L37AE/L43A